MTTTVTLTPRSAAVLAVCGAVLGAALGLALTPLATWADRVGVPVPWFLDLLMRTPRWVEVAAPAVVAAVLGLWVWDEWRKETLSLTVEPDGLVVRHAGHARYVPRTQVGTVHRDGDDLVVLDERGGQLVRADADVLLRRAAAALRDAGYPWSDDGDPYAAAWTTWVAGRPGTPSGADDLLARRRAAVAAKDHAAAQELAAALAAVGVAVRDRRGEQQVRTVGVR
ncbi:YqeB family protein [Cellulomonas telluris]|uniref:YqeB family protein n=1 Tax=Cellulomonas telluris TaxID=2306636 RepID=UPI0014562E83|nr:hypothetical protein [Cellulomonas telluris]